MRMTVLVKMSWLFWDICMSGRHFQWGRGTDILALLGIVGCKHSHKYWHHKSESWNDLLHSLCSQSVFDYEVDSDEEWEEEEPGESLSCSDVSIRLKNLSTFYIVWLLLVNVLSISDLVTACCFKHTHPQPLTQTNAHAGMQYSVYCMHI